MLQAWEYLYYGIKTPFLYISVFKVFNFFFTPIVL
jgi:hypothetical protein